MVDSAECPACGKDMLWKEGVVSATAQESFVYWCQKIMPYSVFCRIKDECEIFQNMQAVEVPMTSIPDYVNSDWSPRMQTEQTASRFESTNNGVQRSSGYLRYGTCIFVCALRIPNLGRLCSVDSHLSLSTRTELPSNSWSSLANNARAHPALQCFQRAVLKRLRKPVSDCSPPRANNACSHARSPRCSEMGSKQMKVVRLRNPETESIRQPETEHPLLHTLMDLRDGISNRIWGSMAGPDYNSATTYRRTQKQSQDAYGAQTSKGSDYGPTDCRFGSAYESARGC